MADGAGHVYGQTIARTLAGLVWLRRGHLELARKLEKLEKKYDSSGTGVTLAVPLMFSVLTMNEPPRWALPLRITMAAGV